MTNAEAIKAFTDMLKAGDHQGASRMLNAPDIVSMEVMDGPMARIEGAEAVKKKGEWWFGTYDVHSITTDGPYANGDQFAVVFDMDFTLKESGQRIQSKEVGLYTFRNGKIVEEKFYYSA
jgi:ketosteroid isomerase-like protein